MITSETSWMTRLNGALDRISELQKDGADALDALSDFVRAHPEHEADLALIRARLALL